MLFESLEALMCFSLSLSLCLSLLVREVWGEPELA